MTQPPRFADRLLKLFCSPHRLEEVQGDLHEEFAWQVRRVGERRARWRYWRDVLGFLKPRFVKRVAEPYSNPSNIDMLRNYLKIALRNLVRHKVYSAINIGGLAVGMAVAMLIGLWIYDELSYNTYHQNYDRLARVMQHQTTNGHTGTQQSIPAPLEKELRTKYGNNFKHLGMATWQDGHILSYGDKHVTRSGNYMGPEIPEMLSLHMLRGSRRGLNETNTILLSASTARTLFGAANPMGKLINIDGKSDVRVTGVYDDLPFNTEFRELTFIAPWALFVAMQPWVQRSLSESRWGNNSFQLFVQLADNMDMETVSARIKNAKLNNVSPDEKKFKSEMFLHPMNDWRLRGNWEEGVHIGGYIQYVRLFGIIGLFVLLLACINFMNLSTARSEKRAKEVGIRKAVGSLRRQVVNQFFSESFLVVIFAFVGAIVLILGTLSWFNEVADKHILFPWAKAPFWLASLGFILVTGLLSGSYPALYLSSFQPVKVLKGTFNVGGWAAAPRKVLVVVQFTVSITLIIGTIIVYRQIQHTKNRPVGYNSTGLVMIQMISPEFNGKYDVLNTDLKNAGVIQEIAESSSPLTDVWSNNGGFSWQGKDPSLDDDFATIWVTHDFGKTVGWQFKEGRDFSRKFSTDSLSLVVNEAAVKFMGLQNPLGTIVRWGAKDDPTTKHFTIIGVIEDVLATSPYEPVKQAFYFMDEKETNWIMLKLDPRRSVSESMAAVESVFKKHLPSTPFNYKFADQEFGKKFASEERFGKLAGGFAVLAILISCLGLFGLASFTAEQRTKEIGVRKVLGASVLNLWGLLSKDFVVLVIISCFIASPIAYYYLNRWLEEYTYRTELSWWIFVVAGVGALFITLLTVSYQSLRAALMNPVKSLRSE
ncbi:permease prefix domain 2-containing transporter [Spirosoma validum]|uniref:ABC transporter permease n=1 Tax=Spirosoma validum TaxID=2771355 RepID=A0A927GD98_9BACT|nr:permease prefix domain 2-containing transporter [Spirosoma validum]MBD2753489.1 ABC transporter permease [Spirosoma validum]